MKFAFLGYNSEKNWDAMSPGERDEMLQECFGYDKKLLKAGHFVGDGTALQPSRTAKVLRWRKGAVLVTDGPFAETKEQLGGVGVLEATDMAHALELVSKHPGLRYGATFEIRPIDEESLRRQATSVAALRSANPIPDPKSARFASLGYIEEGGWGSISEEERDAMLKRCIAFDEGRVKRGEWQSGVALQPRHTAKTVRAKAGQVVVTDGPFAETKEYLGGIVVLAFENANEAIATLSQHPALPFGVAIELRPIHEEISRLRETTIDASRASR